MLAAAVSYVPYPSWLNPGDNTWQITAATFVGLMSLPGLAVLYASIVPKKWAVNVVAHDVRRLLAGDAGLVPVGLQDGVRCQLLRRWRQERGPDPVTGVGRVVSYFIDNFLGKPGPDHQSAG